MIEIEGGIRIVSGSRPIDPNITGSSADQIGLIIEADPDDPTSVQFRVPKEKAGTTHDRIAFYLSGSGRVGIGTKDPETAFDVRDVAEDEDPRDRVAKKRLMQGDRTAATVLTGSLKGNADTAGRLLNAVNIGGVSFTGQASINLPGVNTAGNQNTTGNAATATKLAATKTIGGVAFDGSSDIVPDTINVTTDTANASHFITYVDGSSTQQLKVATGLTYNPGTNTLSGFNISVGRDHAMDLREVGTLNLPDDSISGDKIEGGTITATTITALTSSIISASGAITSGDGSGNEFTVRPNLYFFATNTSATVEGNTSEGSLPNSNTTTVTLTQEQNSHTGVFSLSSNRLTISRAGLYKMSFNVTTELNNGSGRAESFVGLVQETSGGTVSLVDGTEGRGYHRFVAGSTSAASGQSYSANVIVNVAAGSIYDLRFGLHNIDVAGQKLRTIDEGTSFLVEAIT